MMAGTMVLMVGGNVDFLDADDLILPSPAALNDPTCNPMSADEASAVHDGDSVMSEEQPLGNNDDNDRDADFIVLQTTTTTLLRSKLWMASMMLTIGTLTLYTAPTKMLQKIPLIYPGMRHHVPKTHPLSKLVLVITSDPQENGHMVTD